MAMAKQASKDEKDIAAILKAGIEGIQKRGRAVPCKKTMVDVWAPVIEALESGILTKETKQEAVNQTKDMKATKGRASYLGERSIGHLDPGAVSSGYFFEERETMILVDEGFRRSIVIVSHIEELAEGVVRLLKLVEVVRGGMILDIW
jgi:dihydroxyacetone kinase-like protein